LTEALLGGLAGSGAVRLTRLVGPGRAKELLFTAAMITAEQALEWGMVNRVVEDGTALDAARALARVIASRGPVSNRLAKGLVDAAQDMPIDAALSLSTVAQQRIFDSSDLHDGVAAFFAKRAPIFQGR
jgi:enoyl-CoA hydratase/carnithine racemase